jgi:hypothetical protein
LYDSGDELAYPAGVSALPYLRWRLFNPTPAERALVSTTEPAQPATLLVAHWNIATHPEPPRLRWRDRIIRRINSLVME